MKIVLRQDVPKLGEAGTIQTVANGYARNYLIPQGMAVVATDGEIKVAQHNLAVKDRKIAARNYSVDIAYYSQACGYTQMTKEFRDVSRAGAVSQAYNDLASKHRARYQSIDVLGVKSIEGSTCRRPFVAQFNDPKLKFPLFHRRVQPNRKDRAIFKAKQSSRTL